MTKGDEKLCCSLLVLFSGVLNFQDTASKVNTQKAPFVPEICSCQASRWEVESPAEALLCCSLWCGDADGLGSCHQLELPLVARQQVVSPPFGRRGPSLSVGAPRWLLLKREPGGVEGED